MQRIMEEKRQVEEELEELRNNVNIQAQQMMSVEEVNALILKKVNKIKKKYEKKLLQAHEELEDLREVRRSINHLP